MIVMLGTDVATRGGIATVVNAYRDAGLFERWRVRYVTTHRDAGRWGKLVSAVAAWVRFAWLIMAHPVRVVHVHSASRASFWRKSVPVLLAWVARKPYVFHLHGGAFRQFYEQECTALSRAWIRFVLRRAARVAVLYRDNAAWVVSIVPQARVVILPNPAPRCAPALTRSATDAPVILYLGALFREKGLYDLLAAVALLRAHHPSLRLVLAGSGDADGLRARARKLGVEAQLELPGWIGQEQKSVLLRQATLLVLPSYIEAMPMSVLEAMAAGVPVVASRVGGVPDMIRDGVDGLLCAPGDVSGLVYAIETLLANPARAQRMGAAAAARAQACFDAETVVAQLEQIYRELGEQPCAALSSAG